jgi:protein involved in polysaccharide export with SLBB domain
MRFHCFLVSLALSAGLAGPGLTQSTTGMAGRLSDGLVGRSPGLPSNSRGFAEVGQTRDVAKFLRMPKVSADYLLGPGDVIRIETVGAPALTDMLRQVTVAYSGEIVIPMLGSIQAADHTALELEDSIAERLKQRGLIQNPEVLVYITDYQAKPIYVVGEVDNPGEYMMSQRLTLMEAILMAGGLDFTADRYGFLHRKLVPGVAQKPTPGVLAYPEQAGPLEDVIKIDLEPLKTGGVLNPDIVLRSGDMFVVPKRPTELFYVVGDVASPGYKEIPSPQPGSVSAVQAIAMAGGPNRTAKMDHGVLLRYGPDGKRQERRVDFKAMLVGRRPDFAIQAGDIIFIPGSQVKTLSYGLLGAIPAAAETRAGTSVQSMGRTR